MHPSPANDDSAPAQRRWVGLDIARGTALVAMMVFHLTWDLSLFGLIDTDLSASVEWRSFARLIAGSFLTLVGISLVLAHGAGVAWRPYAKRLGVLAGAAALVTLVTWWVFPDSFIYFGILHAIALSTVLALLFLRAPPALAIAAGAACLIAPSYLASSDFNHPAWLWLGLATAIRPTNDYEPILPWFGMVLIGMALARTVLPRLPALPAAWARMRPSRLLAFGGRHSLAVYLLHQPILFGAVWLAAQMIGPIPAKGTGFAQSCETQCRQTGQAAPVCTATCACASTRLKDAALWDRTVRGQLSREDRQNVTTIVQQCLAESD